MIIYYNYDDADIFYVFQNKYAMLEINQEL